MERHRQQQEEERAHRAVRRARVEGGSGAKSQWCFEAFL